MKIGVAMKQFKLYICILLLNEIYVNKANDCCLPLCIKNLNADMYAEDYELICFKLDMIIDTIELSERTIMNRFVLNLI